MTVSSMARPLPRTSATVFIAPGPGDRGENTGAYIGGNPAPIVFGGHYQAVARLDDTTTGCSPSRSCSSCAVSAQQRLCLCRCTAMSQPLHLSTVLLIAWSSPHSVRRRALLRHCLSPPLTAVHRLLPWCCCCDRRSTLRSAAAPGARRSMLTGTSSCRPTSLRRSRWRGPGGRCISDPARPDHSPPDPSYSTTCGCSNPSSTRWTRGSMSVKELRARRIARTMGSRYPAILSFCCTPFSLH